MFVVSYCGLRDQILEDIRDEQQYGDLQLDVAELRIGKRSYYC